jgi:hypothetical protein
MVMSPTRALVKEYITKYYELYNLAIIGLSLDAIEAQAKGLGEKLLNTNPYWWELCKKPSLRGGSPINQLVQAIQAVNALLEDENEGPEPFEP